MLSLSIFDVQILPFRSVMLFFFNRVVKKLIDCVINMFYFVDNWLQR